MASQNKNETTLDAKHLTLENLEIESEKKKPKKSKLTGKYSKSSTSIYFYLLQLKKQANKFS